jgi:YidC/Oxa1 family membrane protein insertase
LKNAHFLWITDLSGPDKLFVVSGFPINILPLAMGVLMFFQQKSTQVPGAATMDEQQKMMMYMFPVLITFFLYNFPAGLALYWASNTLFNLILQKKLVHKVAPQQ